MSGLASSTSGKKQEYENAKRAQKNRFESLWKKAAQTKCLRCCIYAEAAKDNERGQKKGMEGVENEVTHRPYYTYTTAPAAVSLCSGHHPSDPPRAALLTKRRRRCSSLDLRATTDERVIQPARSGDRQEGLVSRCFNAQSEIKTCVNETERVGHASQQNYNLFSQNPVDISQNYVPIRKIQTWYARKIPQRRSESRNRRPPGGERWWLKLTSTRH
ncbi:hypothetical protein CVT26_013190 [Gymnopilus dilepis]|uniref:Uncharacterized protein n=1 Tax=Gymnopilus dilepis TaxID=231916 RepID=A0A409VWC6_9AGAR|nr:hypothetical protein CVT26_013190 [Gymnopilus dilepis]